MNKLSLWIWHFLKKRKVQNRINAVSSTLWILKNRAYGGELYTLGKCTPNPMAGRDGTQDLSLIVMKSLNEKRQKKAIGPSSKTYGTYKKFLVRQLKILGRFKRRYKF